MLIRNAVIDGYPGIVDLRLMHGAVQEIGAGLKKGLYEAEMDLDGDLLSPWPKGMALPHKYRRVGAGACERIIPGSREPFARWRQGRMIGAIGRHSAD